MKRETIICAAVKFGEVIVRGHRHCDCITTAERMRLDTAHRSRDEGFITSDNRFVDRTEAKHIQIEAGIKSIEQKGYCGTELYSEDLY